jgi:hypothetical protein
MGPKTNNGCAGEGQQQITALFYQPNFSVHDIFLIIRVHYTWAIPSRSASLLYLLDLKYLVFLDHTPVPVLH